MTISVKVLNCNPITSYTALTPYMYVKPSSIQIKKYKMALLPPLLVIIKYFSDVVVGKFLDASVSEVFNVFGVFAGGFEE